MAVKTTTTPADGEATTTTETLTYIGLAASLAGVSIPVVGQVALGVVGTICGIWGLGRVTVAIWQSMEE